MNVLNQLTISESEVLRPTQVEIDLDRLTANYQAIEKLVGSAVVMPILKANAYGHGLVEIARHLQSIGCRYLGVAFLEEGILLREAGVTIPILVMGGLSDQQISYFLKYDLTLTASSIDKIQQIDGIAQKLHTKAKVHLKIDTGMERIGVHYYNAENFIKTSLTCRNCEIEGIYSHLASSDGFDPTDQQFTQIQLQRFSDVLASYKKIGPLPRYQHIGNSGAVLSYPQSYYNMVRVGILLYGVYPSQKAPRIPAIQPVLSWKTRVSYFKAVRANQPVSYGSTWKSDHQVRLVTLPIGYGDGYMRKMSNKAHVLINGKKYQVAGTICMDQMMVNIEWDSAFNGDTVVLIGQSGTEVLGCEDLAVWAETIPYEILTSINTRMPRIYIKKN